MTDLHAASALPRLRPSDHKGVRGRVVVVGGDAGMTGAARMASRAAFGAGAGLVYAVAPPVSADALVLAEPDLQVRAHRFDEPPSAELRSLVERADALVIGPGLGRAEGRREFVGTLLRLARAAVIDADALVVFAGAVPELRTAVEGRPAVLTPHPGEFRTLFPDLAGEMELDPWSAAAAASREAGCVVLLKGVPSIVGAEGRAVWTLAAGNPGLATGGSGDILSGLMGTALAQHVEPVLAAALASQILGRAADLAARRTTARSLRPMDVIAALPDLWRAWDAILRARPAPRPPVLLQLESPLTV
jgi:NAD(P)H-hydrate epimerase